MLMRRWKTVGEDKIEDTAKEIRECCTETQRNGKHKGRLRYMKNRAKKPNI